MEPRFIANERGTALLLALVLTALLTAAAAATALTARMETLIAGQHARGLEALYVAEGGMEAALAQLAVLPDWSAALAAGVVVSAPAASWLPEGRIQSPFTVTVRIEDDAADNDGDGQADSNGVVVVHSLARGPAGERRGLRGVVRRPGRLVSVQETR